MALFHTRSLMQKVLTILGAVIVLIPFGAILALSLSIVLGATLKDYFDPISHTAGVVAYYGGTGLFFILLNLLVLILGALLGNLVGFLLSTMWQYARSR